MGIDLRSRNFIFILSVVLFLLSFVDFDVVALLFFFFLFDDLLGVFLFILFVLVVLIFHDDSFVVLVVFFDIVVLDISDYVADIQELLTVNLLPNDLVNDDLFLLIGLVAF